MIGVILPQAAVVATTQKQVDTRVGNRVKTLRRATDRITAKDLKLAERDILDDLDPIYEARREIFIFKLSTEFALNVINGFGVAGIPLLGGWLVLDGSTSIGSVVAALAGLAWISAPWRELIAFYRQLSAARVKFELLIAALPTAAREARSR